MPGANLTEEIEVIIEDHGGSGGGKPPEPRHYGGDNNEDRGKQPFHPAATSQRRYSTAIILAMVSILMFFMAIVSAFLVLRGQSGNWIQIHLPKILLLNTAVLLGSSATLEVSRRRLSLGDLDSFRAWWLATTGLGILFLVGQLVAWRQLVDQGVYLSSNQASSFFYIFTGAHGLHLLGGILALFYVAARKFEKAKISRFTATEVISYYWHFMDGLWVFLLLLLYVGK